MRAIADAASDMDVEHLCARLSDFMPVMPKGRLMLLYSELRKSAARQTRKSATLTDADITYVQGHPGPAQLGKEFSQIHLHVLFGLCPNMRCLPAHGDAKDEM